MEETARVINPWVAEILEQGGGTDAAVRHAQLLAREAFAVSDKLRSHIDREFGSSQFRTEQLETLLAKERELDALRQRVGRGGLCRQNDQGSLSNLLQRRMHEYIRQAISIARLPFSAERKQRLHDYLEARRRQLYLGDAERVRAAISDVLLSCVTRGAGPSVAW